MSGFIQDIKDVYKPDYAGDLAYIKDQDENRGLWVSCTVVGAIISFSRHFFANIGVTGALMGGVSAVCVTAPLGGYICIDYLVAKGKINLSTGYACKSSGLGLLTLAYITATVALGLIGPAGVVLVGVVAGGATAYWAYKAVVYYKEEQSRNLNPLPQTI